jgi:uncharacterized DUF497 family protein
MKLDGIEWDANKAAENFIKHKISFETAQYVLALQQKQKGGLTMAIIKATAKAGQKPSEEDRARIKTELAEARKHPINLDDCPELSPEVLKEFAFMRAEKNRKKQTVSQDSARLVAESQNF